MRNNSLSGGRPRVVSIAGASLVHHVSYDDQVKLLDIAGQRMAGAGVLMAALAPNPLPEAAALLARLAELPRPPDVYLIMPLGGTYGPAGLYQTLMAFAEEQAARYGARFLYYYRRPRDREMIIRLLQDSPHFIGVKIGTNEDDVPPFVDALDPERKIVIWGIGDRSTAAAEMGAKGHTSGISIVVARASDAINNAQRRRDYEAARQIENEISPWKTSASCKSGLTIIRRSWRRSTAPASTMWSAEPAGPSTRLYRPKSRAKSSASWRRWSIITSSQ